VNDVVKDEFKFRSMLTLSGNISFHCNNCDIVITFNGNEYSSKFLMLNYIMLVNKRRAECSVQCTSKVCRYAKSCYVKSTFVV
jgi:hypothetical protein